MRLRALAGPVLFGLFVGCSSAGDVTDRPTGVSTALTITGPAGTTTLLVGATVTVNVHVERTAAFNGPVVVSVRDPAPGVSVSALTIAADTADGALVISADESAAQGTIDLTVVGENPSGVTTAETKVSVLLRGKAGTLDTTFGTGGIGATFDFRPISGVLDQSGKLVIVGARSSTDMKTSDFVVARVGLDGKPDPTFGTGGIISRDFTDHDTALDVVVAPDSKILVAGYIGAIYSERAVVLRFNADGSTDTTFGVSGRATLPLEEGTFYRIALQPDGKILAAGSAKTASGTPPLSIETLARFTAAGAPDLGFGTNGVVQSVLDSGDGGPTFFNAMLFDASGVIVGGAYGSVNGANTYVGKYTSSGTLDSAFGSLGTTMLTPAFAGQQFAFVNDLARTSDNMILALTTHASGNYPDTQGSIVLARMSPSGTLDRGFGKDGLLTIPPGPTGYLVGESFALQPDGKFVLTAYTEEDLKTNTLYLARRMPDGSPDSSFGVDGVAPGASFGKISYSGRPLLQSDGRILLAYAPTYTSTSVARFWN